MRFCSAPTYFLVLPAHGSNGYCGFQTSLFAETVCLSTITWASTREHLSLRFAHNTVADQPAHPCSLISVFVIRYLVVSYVSLLQVKFEFSS